MELKCLIVDDEPLAHKVILEYARDISYLDVVAQAYVPTEALEILRSEQIDLIFLDIKMPKINGLEMLSLLPYQPQVILTTAYEEYALESYSYGVADYLLKPFRFERFIQATEKALNNIDEKGEKRGTPSSIMVKSDKRLVQLQISDIQCLESFGNYVKIWGKEGFLLTPGTLSNIESRLPGKTFYKVHKSFVVSKLHIQFIEGNHIKLHSGKTIPVSKNYKSKFLAFLDEDR